MNTCTYLGYTIVRRPRPTTNGRIEYVYTVDPLDDAKTTRHAKSLFDAKAIIRAWRR